MQLTQRDESHYRPPVFSLDVSATSASTSSSSLASRNPTAQNLSAPAPTSPRHRSSTIKVTRPPPARLNIVSVAQAQTPNPSLSSVVSVQDRTGTGSDRQSSPQPSSPALPQTPSSRPKSPTQLSLHRPSSPAGLGKPTTPFSAAHLTARPSSPTPTHHQHHHHHHHHHHHRHQHQHQPPQPLLRSQPNFLPTQPAPNSHTGFRAHLAHLLPRHAAFTAHLTVHQLRNVPLVHGEFAIKWKVKGVTSPSGGGFLEKVKARKVSKNKTALKDRAVSIPAESRKGKDKGSELDMGPKGSDTDTSLHDGASASVSDTHSIANSSTHSHSNGRAYAANGRTPALPIPSVIVSPNINTPPVSRSFSGASSIASVSSSSSIALGSYQANGRLVHNPPANFLSAEWSPHGLTQSPTSTHLDLETFHTHNHADRNHPHTHSDEHPQPPGKPNYSPAKGLTPFVKLKDHDVAWEQKLHFVIQMGIGREHDGLGDCLAKFVVMQRVVAGDPNAPHNPRLGAVYINLAQYVNAGAVTRSYLLRQSKTNATLKLTIHLEHTAGEVSYVAPPLPKEEILSGVAGLLESSDVYRSRPRTTDLYTDKPSHSSSDEGARGSGSDASSIVSGSGHPMSNRSHEPSQAQKHLKAPKKHRRPFDPAKLPTINDPRGTEKLIEALFNPVPVTQPSKVTPFTYLVEVDGEGGDGDGDGDNWSPSAAVNVMAEEHGRVGGNGDEDDDDRSLYADSPDEEEGQRGEVDGEGSDYHSLRSHPSIQGSLRSKRSAHSIASKAGLKIDVSVADADAATPVSTGVNVNNGAAERRTWWQKVLIPPA